MGYITLSQSISQADYIMLSQNPNKIREFCYWAAKFCTEYPAEGYGLYNHRIGNDVGNAYYIAWEYSDNCD